MPCPEKFRESLEIFDVCSDVIDQIMENNEDIVSKTPKKKKAAFFKRAADLLDEKVDEKTVHDLFAWNACCKGGSRGKASKEFSTRFAELSTEEKLEQIKNVPYMGVPEMQVDGTIIVHAIYFQNGEKYACVCPNFSKLKYEDKVSKSYCYCCAGHFKYHYEMMLGKKLKIRDMISSPLDSKGELPCIMHFELISDI